MYEAYKDSEVTEEKEECRENQGIKVYREQMGNKEFEEHKD